jgi:serine/threonine-protein kinase
MADPIKAVFLAALDTPAERRPAYLDGACGGDAAVRRRVEALLRAHEGTDWLLDRPAWCPMPEENVAAGAATVPLRRSLAPEQDIAGSAPAADLTERAGRVRLLGEIARGGMGLVLRGHDPALGRELAVKVILPDHRDNPSSVRRFVDEARLAGQLQHPGIVPVYDVGQMADGRPFFAMKLIQGRTLAELLAERPDTGHDLPRFLRYFEAVCQAVGYAHSKGVIHRDLKPLNIMVGAFGEVQVMDWGIAKRLEDGADKAPGEAPAPPAPPSSTPLPAALTRPGAVVGTPGYLAPEQARGRAGDRRADVFGLGAILCEVLTGDPPFRTGGLLELLQRTREGDLGDASDGLDRCGADPELIRLAKDCLAVDPAARPADGSAVAARVAEYLAGVQERLRRAEVGQARAKARAEGERTRRRLAVGLGAAVLAVAALGGGTLLLGQHHRAEQDREQARRQQAAESALARAADLRQQSRWAEALVVLEQARQRLDERDGQVNREVRRAVVEAGLIGRLEKVRLKAATMTGGSFTRAQAGLPPGVVVGGQGEMAGVSHARAVADADYEAEFRAAGLGGPDEPAEAVAQRVRDSGVRAALVAALDAWAGITEDRRRHDWALAVAQGADPDDDWGRRLRASWADPAALTALAGEAPIDRLSPHLLFTLATALGKHPEAVPLLRRAQLQYPGDFWLTFFLALWLHDRGELAEAAGSYRAALAIRPDTIAVLVNLGNALQAQKKEDEACDCYRRAIALDPTEAVPLNNLGNALRAKGQLDEAIACYRKAIDADPNDPMPHYNLGLALRATGKVDEAIACCRKAIELDPQHALAYSNLGNALKAKGQLDEAIACYRKAIELDPKDARPQVGLGGALKAKGHVDQAIACYRQAIEIDPDFAEAHCDLGLALVMRGDFGEALGQLRRGHELGSQRGDWTNPSDQWVRNCERLVEQEKQLLDILAGKSEPADARERLDWALLCVQSRRHVAAVRLSAEAFAADAKLADDLEAGHRYRAALAAALAGIGQGRHAGNLTDEARAALRRQALDWLKADLAAWRGQSDEGQRAQALRTWQAAPALAAVRDEEGLAKLPPAERAAWAALWADVEQLLHPAR